MASASSLLNLPDIYNVVDLPEGVNKIHFEVDTRVPNCGVFTFYVEDHTMGNALRMQLLRNESVLFASYQIPHPLENKMEIRVETTSNSSPFIAMYTALSSLISQTTQLSRSFKKQVQESVKTNIYHKS